ncbi:unnamed protein product [Cylicocyclus nassatus]|uniref:RRM domain-containing protein n=1 Tax=Cylicocyclus nassatus TaxID=53992 RepID=A0AA36M0T1_CYLNA|nr:unnamed protein product [Cylicocyclus nassatus]
MSVIIRLQLLPLSAAAADVRAFFSGLRIPDGAVHIVGGDDGDAFIGFATDEDARQAMRRDRGQIHGQEVRLYLSSRAEMNDVITRAKAAVLGIHVPSPPRAAAPAAPPVIQQVTEQAIPGLDYTAQAHHPPPQAYATPVVSEQSMKPSSFAPDPSEFNKPLYMRGPPQLQQPAHIPPSTAAPTIPAQPPVVPTQNGDYHSAHRPAYPAIGESYPPVPHHTPQNARPHAPPPADVTQNYDKRFPPRAPEPKGYPPAQGPYRHDEGFYNKPPQQPDAEPAPRFFGTPPRNPHRPPPPGMTMPPGFGPPKDHQAPAGPPAANGPPHGRPPFGGPNAQFRGPPGPHQGRGSSEESMGGYHNQNQPERYNGPVAIQNQSPQQQDDHRKPTGGPPQRDAFPQDTNIRQPPNAQGPPPFQNRQSGPPSRPFPPQRDSWRTDSTPAAQANGPSWDNAKPEMNRNGPNAAPPFRKPLLSNAPVAAFNDPSKPAGPTGGPGPRVPLPNRNMGPPQSHMNKTPLLGPNFGAGPTPSRINAPSPKYVELSRLPTEMLRPAVLEQFLRPSVPLQISSVKVVYSSQGIHMHTLVRFENAADADSVVARDGEQGIRVRQSSKQVFDEAVDGIPPAIISSAEAHSDSDRKRDDHTRRRTRSRSRSRDRRRNRRDPSPRKRQRSRSRSRERRSSRRSRSRSPKRSRATSTRWCLQLTNVPFRCTEGDLYEWFSERVRPSKITRTFYADGNASDRWIAEFESESLRERAQGIKRVLMGRVIKMVHISNEDADELMKIEDVYGEKKKESSEKHMNEMPHFNSGPPPFRGRGGGAPTFFPAPVRGAMGPSFGRGGPHGPPPMMGMGGPGYRGRGGMGRGMPYDYGRGRGRGAFPGRGGMRGRDDKPFMRSGRDIMENGEENRENHQMDKSNVAPVAPRSPEPQPVAATDDLVASLGPKGTVVSCCGFPSDVTLEDVLGFFQGYTADQNSVRIRMGDDGVPTGECMLAIDTAENASKAVSSLSGKKLRGQVVSLQLANP